MLDSLENIIQAEKYALQTIPLAVLSSKGSKMVWIIVEDEYDKTVYRKFFTINTYIFISQKSEDDINKGWQNVEDIVSQISTTTHACIFGIRDADYTRFNNSYTCPDNIFCTDARDIEMMMFECKNVQVEFSKKYDSYMDMYNLSVSISKEIGFYRAYNDINALGFSFKKKFKFDFLKDIKNDDSINIVHIYLSSLFNTNSCDFSNADFDGFKQSNSSIESNKLCRGHDVIKIITSLIRENVRKDTIEKDLINYYLHLSFSYSSLFHDIKLWCEKRYKVIWNELDIA